MDPNEHIISTSMTKSHCCEEMAHLLTYDPNELPVVYYARFREYGVPFLEESGKLSSAKVTFRFCPWCGTRLPASLRDEWFRRIDALGLEADDPNLPKALKTEEWWRTEVGKRPPNEE